MTFRLHARMILAITLKDVLDAVRNSRILAALLTPLGMGLLFNFILPDASSARRVVVVVAGGESSAFPAALRGAVGPAVILVLREVPGPEAVRDALRQRRADAGLVLPGGFDAAVRAGQEPELTLLVPDSPGVNTGIVAGALEGALREMAGQRRPATVRQEVVRPQSSGTQTISLSLGPRAYTLLLNLVTLVSMIGIFAVPSVLVEESEERTVDALVLVASHADVLVAKALMGLLYIAVEAPLLLALVRVAPVDWPQFVAGVGLFSLVLVGLGLLLGAYFRTSTQVNSWATLVFLPVLFPVLIANTPLPAAAERVLVLMPTIPAFRLAANGLSGQPLFPERWLSVAVLSVWLVVVYGLVLFQLSRREA